MQRLAFILVIGVLLGSVSVKVDAGSVETIEDGIGHGFVYVSFSSQEEIVGFQFSLYTDPSLEAQFAADTVTWEFSTGSHDLTYFEDQEPDEVVSTPMEAQLANFTIFGSQEGTVIGLTLNIEDLNAYDAIPATSTGDDPCEGLLQGECDQNQNCEWNVNDFCEQNTYKPLLKIAWSVNAAGFGYVDIDDPRFIEIGEGGGPPEYVDAYVPQGYYIEDGELSINTADIPVNFALGKAYPNPFNPETRISYSLPQAATVKIKVYDLTGRMVNELVNTYRYAGTYNAVWKGDDMNGFPVATGAYIYQMIAGNFVKSEKLILMK